MTHTLEQLKNGFKEKLDSDPTLSPSYRKKIMTLLEETMSEFQYTGPINSIFPFS
jgi:hypothetical protein